MTEIATLAKAFSEISETSMGILNRFTEIKPETNISLDEAQNYLNSLFGCEVKNDVNAQTGVLTDTVEKQNDLGKPGELKQYFDDKDNLYRIGNRLIPDNKYEINGYKYSTDELGRIISVEGKLRIKEHIGRMPIRDSIHDIGRGFELDGDDRGHLIADLFGGPNGLENMIPQDSEVNRGEFKKYEEELANEVRNGKEVYVKIEPIYSGESARPYAVASSYTIDGEKSGRVFRN